MKRLILFLMLPLFLFNCQKREFMPPIAEKIEKIDTLHGNILIDNYYWMRVRENPNVIEYLNAENNYADTIMSDTKELQEKLYNEILSSIQETDLSVPVKIDDYYYYSRTEEGKNYAINCRKKGSLDAEEEIILDQNELAEGKSYFRLGNFAVSPNHELLAYSTDYNGSEKYTIYIKNLVTGELLSDKIENTYYDLEWTNDNKAFYYTVLNDIHQVDKVYQHILGSSKNNDKLIYQEFDMAFFLGLGKTKDKSTIIISLGSSNESEVRVINANTPNNALQLIRAREDNIEYYLESYKDSYFIWTNEDAVNFKLMTVSKSNPAKENWKEYIPYNENVKINDVEPFADFLVIHIRENGLKKMLISNYNPNSFYLPEFPEEVYNYYSSANPDFNSKKIRFTYTSFITPASVYDYDMQTREMELLKETPVLGGYNKELYETKRIFAKANDGTEIPISLVYKKGLELNGKNPLHLDAYGSYGHSNDVRFSHSNLPLLNRGFVLAIAHVRGGSEMGEQWYLNGKMLHKKNTFTDFIACSEHLINLKYTSPEYLIIEGGSAGGLLIGAVINMRPELYKAALLNVPFVDVINTMLDETIPLTVLEFKEWGNPKDKEYFDYMCSYSPYDNIGEQNYPNILIRAGLYDPRVQYWEPAKFTAKLRELKKDNNLLLLKTNMDSGHSGKSGRYERIREIAFDYSFMFKCLGL